MATRRFARRRNAGDNSAIHKPISPTKDCGGERKGRKLAIGIDPSGRVHFGKDNVGGDHAVAVIGEQVSDAHLAELRADGVS